jgi:hypothetical protein
MLALASIALGAQLLSAAPFPAEAGVLIPVQADGRLRPVEPLTPALEAEIPVCAAVAADETTGALGNGDANTESAAVEDALTQCRGAGGKECKITSVACDPTRSAN